MGRWAGQMSRQARDLEQPASEAFRGGILAGIFLLIRRRPGPEIHHGLPLIFLEDGTVHHKIRDHREFCQRLQNQQAALTGVDKSTAGQAGAAIDDHRAAAAHFLHAAAFPSDPPAGDAVFIRQIVPVIQPVQNPGGRDAPFVREIKGLPVRR